MSPVYYEWFMINGGYSAPTAAVPANFKIPWIQVVTNSTTSITVTFASSGTTPGSYGGSIATSATFNDPEFVINTNSSTYSRNDLVAGQKYNLRVRAYSGAGATGTYGDYIYDSFTMPKPTNAGSITESVGSVPDDVMTKAKLDKIIKDTGDSSDPVINIESKTSYGERFFTRSYLKITNNKKNKNVYALEIKDTNISETYKKYAFGTAILFPSVLDQPFAAGGIGFFTNTNATNGYFVELQTDASNNDNKDRSLKIYKIVGGKRKYLEDSQNIRSKKLVGGILSSTLYKLDVEVTITNSKTTIVVYVNNFKVTAVDVNTAGNNINPIDKTIAATKHLALFSSLGSVSFDYVYAAPVDNETIYRNPGDGQYTKAIVDFIFGEKIAKNIDSPESKTFYLEEFGAVAREVKYVKANFNAAAAIPKFATTGTNKFAKIAGTKFSNHSAEIFVVNNASSFIPLQFDNESFFVVGNSIDNGSQHEYTEETTENYSNVEPVIFQSTWIQSESDAKSLYNWVKLQWSKQQQSISMEIFGNPVIEVGDIVTVNYPKNDLDGTQKFLITNVNSNFDGGLSTIITARSIYSL